MAAADEKKVHISFHSYSCVDLKLPPFPDGQSSLSSEMLAGTIMFAMLLQTCSPWVLYDMKDFVSVGKKNHQKLKNRDIICLTKPGKSAWNIVNLEIFRDYSLTICFF